MLVLFLQVHDPALATPVHMNVGKDGDFGVLPSDGRLCITLRAGILYTSHVHRPAPRLPRCAPTTPTVAEARTRESVVNIARKG